MLNFLKIQILLRLLRKIRVDSSYCRTALVWVLTDGTVVVLLSDVIELFSDEEAELERREKALVKLSGEERRIVGF